MAALTVEEVKEMLRLGWSNHMDAFDNFSAEEEKKLLEWCEMDKHDAWEIGDSRWREQR